MVERMTGDADMAEAASDKLVLGRISGLFGVRGWVKVFSYTAPRTEILELGPWFIRVDGQWRRFPLREGKAHGKGVVARLADVEDRDAAARLLGADIAIDRSQLPQTGPTEYYWADLIGLRVLNLAGIDLGRVDHLLETGANDVLVAVAEDGHERLIPFLHGQVVQKVDIPAGVIRVDWDPDF